ncbi:MAG: hypothetical protein CVT99_12095 [Bacteroidetes bacterium HGW-Bacteroidetes-16]|jgi:hypothetical protein|nr:MAG: hypothetical protein CVT99_12095 [Bacteroidetes bacterium HGW-Bacteroidetes-16]
MKSQINKMLYHLLTMIAVFVLTSATLHAENDADVLIQDRQLPVFTSIKLLCSADLIIQQGNTQQVTVKADSDIIEFIETRVENGTLIVDFKRNNVFSVHEMEVHITMTNLEKIMSLGSGDIELEGGFKTSNLIVSLSGSGDFQADLQTQNMELEINGSGDAKFGEVRGSFKLSVSGSGDVEANGLQLETCMISGLGSGDISLSGNCIDLTMSQMGSGDINAYGLKSVNATVTNMGSGDMVVTVAESLQAKLNGSGDLTYQGDPAKVKVTANGSGEVYKK